MIETNSVLEPDSFYHIYNRANGNELIFLTDRNYLFFLKQFNKYCSPFVETFCYCLMPNHFHLLVKVKSEMSILNSLELLHPEDTPSNKKQKVEADFDCHKLISKRFSNLFSSYTQAFNKDENRKGSLFMKNFKRKKIVEEQYLIKLVHYIHMNPVEAGLVNHPSEWKNCSYSSILSNKKSHLQREQIIELFDNKFNFIQYHSKI